MSALVVLCCVLALALVSSLIVGWRWKRAAESWERSSRKWEDNSRAFEQACETWQRLSEQYNATVKESIEAQTSLIRTVKEHLKIP